MAEGARVVIAGRRVPEGEALAAKLGAACVFRQTDVTVEDQMNALIALAVRQVRQDRLPVQQCRRHRRRPAASRGSRSIASTPRWPPWCAASCSA